MSTSPIAEQDLPPLRGANDVPSSWCHDEMIQIPQRLVGAVCGKHKYNLRRLQKLYNVIACPPEERDTVGEVSFIQLYAPTSTALDNAKADILQGISRLTAAPLAAQGMPTLSENDKSLDHPRAVYAPVTPTALTGASSLALQRHVPLRFAAVSSLREKRSGAESHSGAPAPHWAAARTTRATPDPERFSVLERRVQRPSVARATPPDPERRPYSRESGARAASDPAPCSASRALAPVPRNFAVERVGRRSSPPRAPSSDAYILIDFSNISLGAKLAPHERISVPTLVGLLERDVFPRERVVAGSHPARSSPLWLNFENNNYSVLHAGSRGGAEQFVDEALHARFYSWKQIREQHKSDSPAVLVLATGDGNKNRGGSNFPQMVEAALDAGWHVHLWSWRGSLSSIYRRMAAEVPEHMEIFELDDYKNVVYAQPIRQFHD